ncbi:MAG: tetratricopeptide repeat protein [Flavobacteriales bacterium]|nr:tetratricopeptide repeat protein [Flavobacteriales bacterium]
MHAYLCFLLAPAMTFGQADAFQREYDEATRLDSVGKHAQAVKILDRLVKRPDWEYRARMQRSAILFSHLGRTQEAFEDVTEAMRLRPDSIGPYLNRASYYLSTSMPDRSLADLESGLARCRKAEDSASFYLNMGAAYGQMRKFQDALRSYDNALALKPDDWGSLSNKAAVLDDLGRPDEAKTIYLKLHAQKPEEVVILNNLGFLASNQGDHAEAMRWFDKARKLTPDDAVVLNNLAYAQLRIGSVDEALRNVQRSIKLYPANSYAHRNLGLVWQAKKEKGKACDAFEEAISRGFTAQYGPEVEQLRREYCTP